MPRLPIRIVLALGLMVSAAAQSPAAVGHRAVAWPNTTGLGSPVLDSMVYYPAVSQGANVPVAAHASGWPVVVFLHGYGLLGSDYTNFAEKLVASGFVVVLGDTSQWDYFGQAADGSAMHAAVTAANVAAGGAFEGAFDVQRMALVGHSMGGANVGNVLVANPGYRCGLAIAPVAPLGTDLTQVHAPFGIFAAGGDAVTPWQWQALPYYLSLTSHGSFKFLHVLGDDCDHMELVGLVSAESEFFHMVLSGSLGFLGHCLDVDPHGLEQVFGPDLTFDASIAYTYREVALPQMWLAQPVTIGTRCRASLVVEGGPAVLLAAAGLVPGMQTPYGNLVLDPGSVFLVSAGQADALNRADLVIDVPPNAALVGLPVAFQAVGNGISGAVLLGSSLLTHLQ